MNELVGILHPGEMGVSIAASAQNGGCNLFWASEGRSLQTRDRAEEHSLVDLGTLTDLCGKCSIILSVCPPHAAEYVAKRVLDCSFKGIYSDLNAISPKRAMQIAEMMEKSGVSFVDGSIIGGPAWQPGSTFLYLSGENAQRIANCFTAGPLETEVIGGGVGRASAVKMCYAAFSKGSTALLGAILAAAEKLEIRDVLEMQWSRDDPEFPDETTWGIRRATAKAWRFSGEMEEIAATFADVGLPDGFHKSAADIFKRMAIFKGRPETPELEEILKVILLSLPTE